MVCHFLLQGIFPTQGLIYLHAATKLLQSCPTLCNPIEGTPPGSTVPGILQARTLEWVAISFSNARKLKVKVKSLSRVRLFVTSLPGSFVHGIFQASVLEWVVTTFSDIYMRHDLITSGIKFLKNYSDWIPKMIFHYGRSMLPLIGSLNTV